MITFGYTERDCQADNKRRDIKNDYHRVKRLYSIRSRIPKVPISHFMWKWGVKAALRKSILNPIYLGILLVSFSVCNLFHALFHTSFTLFWPTFSITSVSIHSFMWSFEKQRCIRSSIDWNALALVFNFLFISSFCGLHSEKVYFPAKKSSDLRLWNQVFYLYSF